MNNASDVISLMLHYKSICFFHLVCQGSNFLPKNVRYDDYFESLGVIEGAAIEG